MHLRSVPFVPPPSLVGIYFIWNPDACAIILYNDLLCNGTWSVTGAHKLLGGAQMEMILHFFWLPNSFWAYWRNFPSKSCLILEKTCPILQIRQIFLILSLSQNLINYCHFGLKNSKWVWIYPGRGVNAKNCSKKVRFAVSAVKRCNNCNFQYWMPWMRWKRNNSTLRIANLSKINR